MDQKSGLRFRQLHNSIHAMSHTVIYNEPTTRRGNALILLDLTAESLPPLHGAARERNQSVNFESMALMKSL